MVTKENTLLQFDTSVLDHMSAATTHIMSKCKKGMFLYHTKYALTKSHVEFWSPFNMAVIHFAQSFLLLTYFSRMQNTLAVDILTSATIAVNVKLLSSSGTAPTRFTHLTYFKAAAAQLQTASLTSSCPPQMLFIHQQTVLYDGTLLHSTSNMRSKVQKHPTILVLTDQQSTNIPQNSHLPIKRALTSHTIRSGGSTEN